MTPVTPESIAALKQKLAARGLTTTIANLTVPTAVPLAEAVTAVRQQIADAHALGQTYAIYLGMGRKISTSTSPRCCPTLRHSARSAACRL